VGEGGVEVRERTGVCLQVMRYAFGAQSSGWAGHLLGWAGGDMATCLSECHVVLTRLPFPKVAKQAMLLPAPLVSCYRPPPPSHPPVTHYCTHVGLGDLTQQSSGLPHPLIQPATPHPPPLHPPPPTTTTCRSARLWQVVDSACGG
jgi:hypothetical protein